MTQKNKDNTVLWWIGWITLTIVSFFAASAIWTPVIARFYGPVSQGSGAILWVAAVFGTWMIFLVPLIVIMYNKVDRAYDDARARREGLMSEKMAQAWNVKSIHLPEGQRLLPRSLKDKLKKIPRTMDRGHLVSVRLKDGRIISNVFILDREQMLGIYDYDQEPFKADDIVDLDPMDWAEVPAFTHDKWLRLDGFGS